MPPYHHLTGDAPDLTRFLPEPGGTLPQAGLYIAYETACARERTALRKRLTRAEFFAALESLGVRRERTKFGVFLHRDS